MLARSHNASRMLLLALCALPAARGQDEQPREPGAAPPALVDEVLVPEESFDEVLKRHPGGVIVKGDELRALLDKAARRPDPTGPVAPPPPVAATLERVRVDGKVNDGVADLEAEAEVSLLGKGPVFLRLPLQGIGLRAVLVDGKPARLLRSDHGPVVMLEGPEGTKKVLWRFAVRVEPGEERGSGSLAFPVPGAASGRLTISLPGDVEVHASQGAVVWAAPAGGATTTAQGAFGGAADGAPQLSLAWRPRRALQTITPYAAVDESTLLLVGPGVVTLDATLRLAIHRAERGAFQIDLPPGFVVRLLESTERSANGEDLVTHAQQGDRVMVRLAAPREGLLEVRLRAELATGNTGTGSESLVLRPLGFPDVDRVSGVLGVARVEGSRLSFGEVSGLERADLDRLSTQGNRTQSRQAELLRVYRRGQAAGKLEVESRPLEPRVDLQLKAAFQLEERSISALAAFRFMVTEGRVFAVRCELPPGFELETAVLRDGDGNEPDHQQKLERSTAAPGEPEKTSLVVELTNGLRAGQELLVTVQARREEPRPLAGQTLGVPRLAGSPADRVSGYLGFSPDASFRLQGTELVELTPIPANELPRVGLDVPGLMLGYRIEAAAHAGKLRLLRRETRISCEALLMHRVREQVVETEARLELDVDVQGAPISALELLVPAGVGRLMRVVGPAVQDDRELLGTAPDGRERWRIPFNRRQTGRLPLTVTFDTTLPAREEGELVVESLPRVSVAEAFRDRGTIAIYSSDATELEAAPSGLRAIEVTEVPGAEGRTRPLFAYTYVGQEQKLGLTIRRRPSAEVLTAVAEALRLKSTVGSDGLARHEATFEVKNLNNQFFALRLPEGATLWSVAVDDPEGKLGEDGKVQLQGVKPAEQDGLRLIPIPSAGTKGPNELTRIVATYTLAGPRLTSKGQLDLVAPALLVVHHGDRKAVPVLHSTWELALPEEVRVLELGGNLTVEPSPHDGTIGRQIEHTPSLALAAWNDLSEQRSTASRGAVVGFGLLLLCALVSLSGRVRRHLVVGLAGLFNAARSARTQAGRATSGPPSGFTAAAIVVGLVVILLITAVTSFRGALNNTFNAATRKIDTTILGGYTESAPPTATAAPAGGDYDDYGYSAGAGGAPGGAMPMEPPAQSEASRDEVAAAPDEMRKQLARLAPPAPPPAAQPAPRREMPRAKKADGAKDAKTEMKEGLLDDVQESSGEEEAERQFEGGRGDRGARFRAPMKPGAAEPGAPPPPEEAPAAEYAPQPLLGENRPADGPDGAYGRPTGNALPTSVTESDKLGMDFTPAPEPKLLEHDVSLGHVGLRSLVLDLRPVGQRFFFKRAGGSPELVVRYVRERFLTLGGGALVVLAFVAALLLPRFGVSYLGILVVAGAALTALPFVALPGSVTPALNALLAGAVLAAPVHLAILLHGWWQTAPISRLSKAVAAVRGPAQAAVAAPAAAAAPVAAAAGANDWTWVRYVVGGLYLLQALVVAGFAVAIGVASTAATSYGSSAGVFGLIIVLLLVAWALVAGTLGVGLIKGNKVALVVAIVLACLQAVSALSLGALPLFLVYGAVAGGLIAGWKKPGMIAVPPGAAALVLALLLFGAGAAQAQEPPPTKPAARVYVPYDPATYDPLSPSLPDRVYVPREVYEQLWLRAYPDRAVERPAEPPAPAVVTRVEYEGQLDPAGLGLTVRIGVDVLAEGWQRCALGLSGTGLEGSKVLGGLPDARVVPAAAGGFELSAQGPGSYEVTLQVKAASTGGGWTFSTVPALAAELRLTAPAGERRVVVGGARAQTESVSQGKSTVVASLGDAPRVSLTWAAREVLTTGGASEASASTHGLVWVRRGRLQLVQATTFAISGAGREGFVFTVPAGLEVTAVEVPSLRSWSVESGKLTVALRRPSEARVTVTIAGEQLLPDGQLRFAFPQLEAQGVSREAGSLGYAVEEGLKVRPIEPSDAAQRLRQVGTGDQEPLARRMTSPEARPQVERAFELKKKKLELELIQEAVEVKTEVQIQAITLADRARVKARIGYEVRKGALYELIVAVPAEYQLAAAPVGRGLTVREVDPGQEKGGVRHLRFGLASGLQGQASLELVLERRHALGEAGAQVPFPDLRTLGAAQETTTIGLAAAPGIDLRSGRDPAGLSTVDVRSATGGWPAPEAGGEWRLAWRRTARGLSSDAAPARSEVQVRRPTAKVTGNWVLHVRVEHDVARYVLRALYSIEEAGCRTFSAVLPASVGDRVTVEAPNLREVTTRELEGGLRQYTVELQSPAESFYDLALSWEEIRKEGQPFVVERVGVTGVDRQVRGFVLVEKAADVPDQLQLGDLAGEVQKSRAADAPALPPGRSHTDFAYVYRIPLGGEARAPWSIGLKLEPAGTQLLPSPARVPWAKVTTVVTSDGRARHRALYRVRNLRLQFLALELPRVQTPAGPVPADVWSVFVDGEPKRLHREGETLLIPLPKRTDADLSFDVEVTYATPLPAGFGFGARIGLSAPVLRTEKVEVEKTYWTLHMPADWDYGSSFAGNVEPSLEQEAQVAALVKQVEELKTLERLAKGGSGKAQRVADGNVLVQCQMINESMGKLGAVANKTELQKVYGDNLREFQALERSIADRRREAQAQTAQQADQGGGQQVLVEGKNFEQMASGWYSNNEVVGPKNRVEWSGLEGQGQTAGQAGQSGDAWTLEVQGQQLDLRNAEVFQTKGGKRAEGQQRMLKNKSYDAAKQQAEVQKQEQEAYQQQGRFQANMPQGQQALGNLAQQQQLLRQGGQQPGQSGAWGDLPQNAVLQDPNRLNDQRTPRDDALDSGQSEGLLSIRVDFPTPGKPFHFVSKTTAAPEVVFTVYPLEAAERGGRIARGVVLLVLLLGALRLGLLRPIPGKGAVQLLLLVAVGGLAAAVFAHVAGAAVAFLVGVLALRHGPIAAR